MRRAWTCHRLRSSITRNTKMRSICIVFRMTHSMSWQKILLWTVNRLIFVYSTGRSGSTLVGAALNAVDGVVGISEPDVFTQLVTFRDFGGSNQDEISALVDSCMKLQCKPTEQIPNPVAWAVKFRSFSTELGDLLYEHFPSRKTFFYIAMQNRGCNLQGGHLLKMQIQKRRG